jgi:hypothetical protein
LGPAWHRALPYDIASISSYREINSDKAKLAMKMGKSYELRDIGRSRGESSLQTCVSIPTRWSSAHAQWRLNFQIACLLRSSGCAGAGIAHAGIDKPSWTDDSQTSHDE